jgi:hypothetical protein
MSVNTYDVGETVILTATFRNEDGDLATPTTTTLYIERPDGTTDTVNDASLTDVSAGVLEYADTCEARGNTWYRFVGVTSSRTVVEEGRYVGRRQHAVPS